MRRRVTSDSIAMPISALAAWPAGWMQNLNFFVSATLTAAFLGASVLPVYGVFLMPEIFNFAIVFVAYFLWLYKEVAPESRLCKRWTDFAAAAVLVAAAFLGSGVVLGTAALVIYGAARTAVEVRAGRLGELPGHGVLERLGRHSRYDTKIVR